jgi:hypothetical protein
MAKLGERRGDGDREAGVVFWAPALATEVDSWSIPVATGDPIRVRVYLAARAPEL